MIIQHSPDEIPPPYTPGRAPPSYGNTEGATPSVRSENGDDLDAGQPAPRITSPAPAATNLAARVPRFVPPVTTRHTAYDSSRLPFKFTTVPSRAYVPTATSHTWVDMSEPDLTTQPMVRSSQEISTTPSEPSAHMRRKGCCACIASLILVAIVVIVVVLLEAKGHSDADSPSTTSATTPSHVYTGKSCAVFVFC
jgi:hypothetical protein